VWVILDGQAMATGFCLLIQMLEYSHWVLCTSAGQDQCFVRWCLFGRERVSRWYKG
jgi:hypothetical protein